MFLIILFGWLFTSRVLCWENLTSSLNNNCFGTCSRSILSPYTFPTYAQLPVAQWVVTPLPPSSEEVALFRSLPLTLTRSNPKLGMGMVNGQPAADKWVNQAANSWQLAPDHPRNNKKNCVRLARLTGETAVEIYDAYKIPSEFYIISARNAVIHDSGVVALSCGYYQPTEGCETIFKFIGRKWYGKCKGQFRSQSRSSRWPDDEPSAASWDNNYHHFIIDSLVRLSRHLDFLKANPDVKIHIRRYEQYAKKARYVQGGIELRRRLIALLGLEESQFISGPVFARLVHIPRGAKCNYPISHAYEIRKLTEYMKSRALHESFMVQDSKPTLIKPLIKAAGRVVIQHRHCDSSAATCGKDWRDWNSTMLENVRQELRHFYPNHQVTVMSSGDQDLMNCLHCQIKAYDEADVLVGLHGAGLTNMIFMRPGSLVVEIVGKFDGRMLPLCGYHGSLAAIFGLHHYIFYYDWKAGEVINTALIAKETSEFLRFLRKK